MAEVDIEPPTSHSRVRDSTTRPSSLILETADNILSWLWLLASKLDANRSVTVRAWLEIRRVTAVLYSNWESNSGRLTTLFHLWALFQ